MLKMRVLRNQRHTIVDVASKIDLALTLAMGTFTENPLARMAIL